MAKQSAKRLIPLCMILGILLLWYMHKGQETLVESDASSQGVTISSHSPVHPDFALSATHIDMEALKKHNLPIIIDFGADSCIPCKAMAPVLVKLNGEMQGKAIIKFVDVWKNREGAKGYPVQVIPTQVFFLADGTPYTPKDVDDIEFSMYGTKDSEGHAFTTHQGGLTEDQMRRILEDMGTK